MECGRVVALLAKILLSRKHLDVVSIFWRKGPMTNQEEAG